MSNRVKVVICGKEYTLKTEDSPSYIYGLAKGLEKRISEISSQTGSSPYNSAIMAGFHILDELSRAQNTVDEVREQIKYYVDEAGKAKLERDSALSELEVLKNKIEQLESLLKLKTLKDSI